MEVSVPSSGLLIDPLRLANTHLNLLDPDADQVSLIRSYLRSATDFVEATRGIVLTDKTLVERQPTFPCVSFVTLLRWPVQSIVSIQYTDSDDARQTFASTDYRLADPRRS
jgi:hypothetical protein